MNWSGNNIQKIRKSNRKHYRDPLSLERRNKDKGIDKLRSEKYDAYDLIMRAEYGKFN